jgi:hypothetical protein
VCVCARARMCVCVHILNKKLEEGLLLGGERDKSARARTARRARMDTAHVCVRARRARR